MPNKVTYEYAIIRIVPKVEREEFLNVGVILYSKRKKYLGIKYNIDAKRLTAFSDSIDIEWLTKYLDAWKLEKVGAASAPAAKTAPVESMDFPAAENAPAIEADDDLPF